MGFKKIDVVFNTISEANDIARNPKVNGIGLTATVPYRCTFRQCIVKGFPEYFDLNVVRSEGTSDIEIANVETLHKFTKSESRYIKVPTRNLIVTFVGDYLPN